MSHRMTVWHQDKDTDDSIGRSLQFSHVSHQTKVSKNCSQEEVSASGKQNYVADEGLLGSGNCTGGLRADRVNIYRPKKGLQLPPSGGNLAAFCLVKRY